MKSALATLALQIGMTVLFYLWQVGHYEGAENVLVFVIWTISLLGICMGIFIPPEQFLKIPKSPFLTAMKNRLFSMCVIVAMVWSGHTVLATFYVLAGVLIIVRTGMAKEAA